MDEQAKDAILSGYRALDLTDEKGAFCSRLLADMGCEVIRAAMPGENPPPDPYFWESNLGKRAITLNIETAEGQSILKKLAVQADFVVESHAPGYLAGLGIGYTTLSEINPRLIMASITGFGQDGPHRDYHSCDLVASARGGHMHVSGELGRPPLPLPASQVYRSAGLCAATGILLALWHRHDTGKGQHIDISLQECAAATLDHVLVRYFHQGIIASRRGNLYWNSAFRTFPCRDGDILLSLLYGWPTLVEWLDSEGMAGDLRDDRWQDRGYRIEHIDHVTEVLEQWTQGHTAAELVEKGQLMRFPWAKAAAIPEVLASPQLKERDFFIDVEYGEAGQNIIYPGAPCRLSCSPWRVGSKAPASGEANGAVFGGELDLPTDELADLERKGVI